ncbi:hypothetical protein DL95DRAFT_382518 [Leptodontidium sp. 2 PMI_412]|nr:hypothetical protein BKA61DRAFT_349405 [Leptodontidium sp. MPI-SDFR-AT-0119]KAH9221112.1 hypothetical protein DL95DRAFT_382518 [Leptodontidium sp. 2 PMI_412]
MTEQEDKPKKTRKRGPNVKAGCATCKIRHKKCDQTRPACLRCTSTGRTCDFLSSLAPNSSFQSRTIQLLPDYKGINDGKTQDFRFRYLFITEHPKSLPSFATLSDPDEAQHFDFFRVVCTHSFSMHFNANLWKGLILQAAHTEPFVLHAVLAIGALTRSNVHAPMYPTPVLEYSLKKYSLASRMLSQRMKSGTADWKLAILGSLVFLALEVLQGHEMGALIHMRSGEAILKSLPSSKPELLTSLATSGPQYAAKVTADIGDSEDLVTAYTRLSVEEYPFLGLCGSSYTPEPKFPLSFNNLTDARSSLNSIVAATYSFYRRHGSVELKTLPLEPLPTKIAAELCDVQTLLQSWRQEMDRFIVGQEETDEATSLGIKAIMIQYLVAFIRTSTYFFKNQLVYDQYLPQFKELVDLTAAAVLADHSPYLKSRGKGPCYTLDMALAQPLYFVACRCRDPELRRQAICLMKLVGKDGVYTGEKVAKVAGWVVATEEGESPWGFVGEERRFHDVSFDFDMKTKIGRVWATRRSVDGEWQQVSQSLVLE